MSLGAFTLIKNEAHWVGFCIMSCKDFVDEFVFYDGNSTDGTVDLLNYIKKQYKVNIKVFTGKDPKNLQDDYVKLFNDCIGEVESDFVWFLHPDMICIHPPLHPLNLGLAYSVEMKSFAGDPGGRLLEIVEGRTDLWKTIMKNDLGLHYYGHYGSRDEDMYFKEITGEAYTVHKDMNAYPYDVNSSGILMHHYSDVRPFERRLGRMKRCLENQGFNAQAVKEIAAEHPRVSLKEAPVFGKFSFKESDYTPEVFSQYAEEFAGVLGKSIEETCYIGGLHA